MLRADHFNAISLQRLWPLACDNSRLKAPERSRVYQGFSHSGLFSFAFVQLRPSLPFAELDAALKDTQSATPSSLQPQFIYEVSFITKSDKRTEFAGSIPATSVSYRRTCFARNPAVMASRQEVTSPDLSVMSIHDWSRVP